MTAPPAPLLAADAESAAVGRVRLVERLLGDPEDPGNDCGYRAVLASPGAGGETPPPLGRALRTAGLGGHFVPAALGGSLGRLDTLARTLRPVFRRDVSAGLELGAGPFRGALPVWCAGSADRRRRTADLLLDGGGIALRQGARSVREAFAPAGLRARRTAYGFELDGECAGLRAAPGTSALLLHATVGPGPGGGPTVLLADLAALPRDRLTVRPDGRVEFTACPLPAGSAVGEPGGGAELFLRTLQICGSVVASMSLGAADTCLRQAAARALVPRGRRREPSPKEASALLGGAFLDLLACDCLALVGTRAVGVVPDETSVLSAAVRCVVPVLLGDALRDLAALMGPQSLREDGPDPLFARHARTLGAVASPGAGSFIGRAAVLPQLPRLARQAWFNGPPAPDTLFDPAGDLPPFAPERVTLRAERDGLSALLGGPRDPFGRTGAEPGSPPAGLRALFRAELRSVQAHFAAVPEDHRGLPGDPRSLALADRYLLVLTAAACLGCYEAVRSRGGFWADPAWITGILRRLARRLDLPVDDASPAETGRVHDEVMRRFLTRRGFDLYETPLEG